MKRRIPVASAKKGTNYVTIEGVTTYPSRVESGAINWKPSKLAPMGANRMQMYINDSKRKIAADKIVKAFGMNENYRDTFRSPFKD